MLGAKRKRQNYEILKDVTLLEGANVPDVTLPGGVSVPNNNVKKLMRIVYELLSVVSLSSDTLSKALVPVSGASIRATLSVMES